MLDGVEMNADLVNDISMYEALDIPAGNYEFDRPWTDGTTTFNQPGFTSFRFDPIRFPHSDEMLAALKRRGYHVLVFGAPWAAGREWRRSRTVRLLCAAQQRADRFHQPRCGGVVDE